MAYLTESADEHNWDLAGYRVIELTVDVGSVRLRVWTTHAEFVVRLGASFVVVPAAGASLRIDPEHRDELLPVLRLLTAELAGLRVTRAGALTLTFADGTAIHADADPAFEAWEVEGGGALEHIGYLASPGGGSPWGR